jgi:hypothetical protein
MSDIRTPKSDKRKDWKDFPTFSTRVGKCHLTLKQVVGNTRFNIANTHYHYTPASIPVYQSMFPRGFVTKILYALLVSDARVTCATGLVPVTLMFHSRVLAYTQRCYYYCYNRLPSRL